MTGAEAARRLRACSALAAGLRDRAELDERDFARLVGAVLGIDPRHLTEERGPRGGMSNAEKCRRYRRRSLIGVDDTVATGSHVTPNDTDSTPVTPPSCPPLASPPDLPLPEKDKENKSVRAREGNQERRPSCLSEALEHGVCSRAELVLTNARDTEWVLAVQPQNWPEVRRAAERFAKGTGRPGDAKLGSYARDAGTRAIVELFAAGHMPSAVDAGLERIASSEWYRSAGPSRGLSSITPEVFRREGSEQHAAAMEVRPRATETAPHVEVVPPPPEVTAALDGLVRGAAGKAGIAAAKRARAAGGAS